KIPMLLMETKLLGLSFAAVRLVLTMPAIIVTGYLMERLPGLEWIPAEGPGAPRSPTGPAGRTVASPRRKCQKN
ncbi:MAG: hypothetical protein QW566_06340, partial [Candidatus Jordarchaeales archaeon]